MAGLDDLLADLFAPMGDITLRRMFGGIGSGIDDYAWQAVGGRPRAEQQYGRVRRWRADVLPETVRVLDWAVHSWSVAEARHQQGLTVVCFSGLKRRAPPRLR